ncbi:MAG: sel1 repeat family protein [Opitutaceae bacterium]|nr:sel1 repeat family protein [Opitutaceae bacterium]
MFFAAAVAAAPLGAAPKAAKGDAPPVLISKEGAAPKWQNVAQLQQFAAKGDLQACFELAERCTEGDGVPKDLPRAAALFRQAAEGGMADGWFRLGKFHHDGLIGPVDYAQALEYFTTAARLGVAEAQHNLGAMLVSGRGVKRDYVEGLAWLIVSIRSGAVSEAETQVRTRLSKQPAEIKAAEARAAEIAGALAKADVKAVLLKPRRGSARPEPTQPIKPVSTPAPPPRPVITPPKVEPLPPPRISVPLSPPNLTMPASDEPR